MAKKVIDLETGKISNAGIMDAAAFAALQGEKFLGLNILKLEPNTGAGPFVLSKILPKQDLGGGKKKMEPVDVYVAIDANNVEIRMPIAASFIGKAKDSKLSLGDKFAVFRTSDYKSKAFKTEGKGYNLTIITRAKK